MTALFSAAAKLLVSLYLLSLRDEARLIHTAEALSALLGRHELVNDAPKLIENLMIQFQHDVASLWCEAASRFIKNSLPIATYRSSVENRNAADPGGRLRTVCVSAPQEVPARSRTARTPDPKAHKDQRLKVDR